MVQWCCLVQVFFTDPCKTQANLKSFSRKIKTLNLQIQTQAFGNSVAFVGAKAWDTVVELVTRPDPTQADGDWGLKPKSGPYNSTESEWTGVMGQVVNGKHHICLTQWIMNPPRYENHTVWTSRLLENRPKVPENPSLMLSVVLGLDHLSRQGQTERTPLKRPLV